VWWRAAWAALLLVYFCVGWPIIRSVNAMELTGPLSRAEISLCSLVIRDTRGGSHKEGFIDDTPVENIFIFKLHANSKQQSIHDWTVFAQKAKQQHVRHHCTSRMFFSHRDADASYLSE
jgi:hypothetical protein